MRGREVLCQIAPQSGGHISVRIAQRLVECRVAGLRIGEHVGLAFYTLGQRKGCGIGGARGGSGDPWFVAPKDLETNTLYVVQGHDHPWLLSSRLSADHVHWIAGSAPAGDALGAKTRYRQSDAACRLQVQAGADELGLVFDQPQWAVTPGQSAVFYDGEVCLGGGVIAGIAANETPAPTAR